MSPRVWVAGKPAPQGSKRHVGGGRMVESSKAVGPWRERVGAELARLELGEPSRAAIVVNARFCFTRPKSHLRVNGSPRGSAPRVPATRPDLDKLVRAVLDAMSGVVFVDDAQVVALNVGKEYGNADGLELTWNVIA